MAEAISTQGNIHAGHYAPGENYLNTPKGIKSWLTTIDHKRIGIMYLLPFCSSSSSAASWL